MRGKNWELTQTLQEHTRERKPMMIESFGISCHKPEHPDGEPTWQAHVGLRSMPPVNKDELTYDGTLHQLTYPLAKEDIMEIENTTEETTGRG